MSRLGGLPDSRNALAAEINLRGPHRRSALRARISTVIGVLATSPPDRATTAALLGRLEQVLVPVLTDRIWLALAVISGELPDQDAVLQCVRVARLDGPLAALAHILTIPAFPPPPPGRSWPGVRVLADRVLVDLHETSLTDISTGIQRVARETSRRWERDHDVTLIGWTKRFAALHELSPDERGRALGHGAGDRANDSKAGAIVVPWRCTYLLPELISEPKRNRKLQALLRFSGNRGASIGFDLVPLTSAETTAEGMGQGFATALAATSYIDHVATISDAAATEYCGWREMLAGAGLRGPQITAVMLATEVGVPSPDAIEQARQQLVTDQLPMVLCVGSHEPRKNHLALLHAAELLWRQGIEFSLVFIGGNGWRGERLVDHIERLQAAGRPIVSVRALPDDLLWAAYRLAHCLVFPSLNEGFGLPIAEALASGTPVLTSCFGSMKELADGGGALTINPRDDHDIAAGLRRILTDETLRSGLADRARRLPVRSWDAYAAETWAVLMENVTMHLTEVEAR